MKSKLLVFDSHPVQYRVPIWRGIESRRPGLLHVIYGSDCSVRGHVDQGFSRTIAWDGPMLEGYRHTVLNCEKGIPLSGWSSLTGTGVTNAISKIKPSAVFLTGLNYRYDLAAYLDAKRCMVPIWLRCETQDYAVKRSMQKSIVRSVLYALLYSGIEKAFYIGELNRRHYLRHGVPVSRLRPARYGTVDRLGGVATREKQLLRDGARRVAGIGVDDLVIGFSGKLIQKKNPELLFSMLKYLPEGIRRSTALYFLGSGEMESHLKRLANEARHNYDVRTYFAGFANQSELPKHYLAMDVLVLPSRRMGETWGLVANEAMQAGCSVAVSDAVGCGVDFASWERFRVFAEDRAPELAQAICELANFPRDFNWAAKNLLDYSVESTVEILIEEMDSLADRA